jgi:signal peptide peptidase SppA
VSGVLFHGSGIYAILPQAFGLEFPLFVAPPVPFRLEGKCAVVEVCGALAHANPMLQTYAQIVEAAKLAAASEAEVVAVKIASPGGDVYGAFDCARAVAAAIRGAGKRYVAFTEAQACSSAYALASQADEIVISDTATVGSIGVIATSVDTTKADAAQGLRFAIVASGAHKADGNPHVALTEEALSAIQTGVDATADVFFDLVARSRRLSPEAVRGFEARTFVGANAVSVGLADRISTWEALLCELREGVKAAAHTSSAMAYDKDKDETRKALAAAAEDKDPDKSARAKRALAAFDEYDKDAKAEDDKGDEDEKKDKAAAPAGSSAKAEDDKDKDDKAKAASALPGVSAGTPLTAKEVQAIVQAQLDAAAQAAERTALLASRPDVAPSVIKALANAPIEQIKAVLDGFPKGPTSLVPELARSATQGATAGEQPDRLPKAEADALSIQMGLTKTGTSVIETPNALILGAPQVS